MMRALVLGAASLATGATSAQTVYPSGTAPLYDYAGPASSAPVPTTPLGYGPLIYAPQLFAPTSAFPTPPAAPGYYTAQSVVVSQPSYDYAPSYWAAAPDAAASIPARTTRYYGYRMYMVTVNRAHKGSKLTPANNDKP